MFVSIVWSSLSSALAVPRRVRPLMLAGMLLGVAACSGEAEDICDEACDCERCSDADYATCVLRIDAEIDAADAYGCSDDAEKLVKCVLDRGRCEDDSFHVRDLRHWDSTTGDYVIEREICSDEWQDLEDCEDRDIDQDW